MILRWWRAQRLFTHGQRLAARGCHTEALTALRQAVALRPQGAIWLHRALAAAEVQQWQEAWTALEHALRQQPGHPVLLQFGAQIAFDQGAYEQAKAWCARALAHEARCLYATILMALCDLALGRIAVGYHTLMQPLPLPPGERILLWLTRSRPPALVQLANAALQSRLLLVTETYLRQHAAVARSLVQQLGAARAAENPGSCLGRCLTCADRLLTRGIMRLWRAASALRWHDQQQRCRRRQYLEAEEAYYLGQYEAALPRYRRLLHQEPALQPRVLSRLVEIYWAQGEVEQALIALRRLRQRQGEATNAEQLAFLGTLLCYSRQYTEAMALLEQALTRGFPDATLFYCLGVCHLQAGTNGSARRYFARAVTTLNPGLATLRLQEMYRVFQHVTAGKQAHGTEETAGATAPRSSE